MGIFDFLKKTDPDLTLPKTSQEIWFRDTYAIWSQANFGAFQHFCGLEKSSDNASQCRFLLGRDWNTLGKVRVLELFDTLTGVNDDTIEIISDLHQLKNSPSPEKQATYSYLRITIAWDLCRATQIMGMAYHGGWIDRELMNQKSAVAGKLMQQSFCSWSDLVTCYLDGYRDWAREEFEPDVARENIRLRQIAYETVKNHVKPAYMMDWNLEL